MDELISVCPSCKKKHRIVPSNNPLVVGICENCLNEQLDYNNLKQADFFCRTYNLPWLPEKWCTIAEVAGEATFWEYVNVIADEYPHTVYNEGQTGELWESMSKEWHECLTHDELLSKIKPIKEKFIQRMQIKWGPQYTFEELLKLEHLFTNTAQSAATTNPLTLDIIRKIATVSVAADKALYDGDIKAAAEFVKMHKTLIDSAGISDMVEVGQTDVISSVAELCDYVEGRGFQYEYYDGVARDIVDKTILDQQEWYRNFILNASGIQQTYELIEQTYKNKLEQEKTGAATSETSIEELLEQTKKGIAAANDDDAEIDIGEIEEIDDTDF